MLSFLGLMAIVALVYSGMSPEARRRLAQRAVDLINLALGLINLALEEATRIHPECDHFRDALRARTRWAVVTPALVLLNVGIYVLMLREPGVVSDPETIIRWGGNFWLRTRNGEWQRLLTATFVHPGFFQLLVNVAGMAQISLILERLVGRLIVVAVFLTAGVFASIVNLTTHPLNLSYGASGAIFGLYGLLVASVIWGIRHRTPLTIPLMVVKRIAPAAGIFLLYNLVTDSVGSAGELTGLLVGLTWGAVLARGVNDLKPAARRLAHLTATAAAIVLLAAVALRGATDVKPELARTAAVEDRTAGVFRQASEQFKMGRTNADALATLIDRKIIPELRAADARLKALVAVPDEHQPLVTAAEEYVRLRTESWRLRADYLRKAGRPPARGAETAEYRTNNRTFARAESAERAALDALKTIQN